MSGPEDVMFSPAVKAEQMSAAVNAAAKAKFPVLEAGRESVHSALSDRCEASLVLLLVIFRFVAFGGNPEIAYFTMQCGTKTSCGIPRAQRIGFVV